MTPCKSGLTYSKRNEKIYVGRSFGSFALGLKILPHCLVNTIWTRKKVSKTFSVYCFIAFTGDRLLLDVSRNVSRKVLKRYWLKWLVFWDIASASRKWYRISARCSFSFIIVLDKCIRNVHLARFC